MNFLKKLILLAVPVVIITLLVFKFKGGELPFSEKIPPEELFLTINKKQFSQEEYSSFAKMLQFYPAISKKDIFPGIRREESIFIETELFYDEAKKYSSYVFESPDWKMKQIYLPGQIFSRDVLKKRRGSTDKELKAFYEENKAMFEGVSTGGTNSFGANFLYIIDSLFVRKYPPVETFYQKFPGTDSAYVMQKWIDYHTNNYFDFFLNYFYEKKYGTEVPKNYEDIVGVGLPVSEEEVEVVINWLVESKRDKARLPENRAIYARFILGWKLFGEEAEAVGFTKLDFFKGIEKAFEKYNLVAYYINNILRESISVPFEVVDEHLIYAYWDSYGQPLKKVADSVRANFADKYNKQLQNAAYYQKVYEARTDADIVFHKSTNDDGRNISSIDLYKKADSLKSVGQRDKSIKYFKDLTQFHLLTEEGPKAYLELAKIYNNKGRFEEAINNYRNYILFSGKGNDFCETYFMIAYIYGEEMKDYEQAHANYQWVIKNAPDCNMVDDAEFMMLHLGEPMPDVNELRNQASRQGITK